VKIKELLIEEKNWTPQMVHDWLATHHDDGYGKPPVNLEDISVNNGEVAINTEVHLMMKGSELPFKFADKHDYEFTLYEPKSLKGCPKIVGGFAVFSDKEISLAGAPEEINDKLILDVPSLKDVHKYIKRFKGKLLRLTTITRKCVLGILLINGIKDISLIRTDFTDKNEPDVKHMKFAVLILKKYLGEGKAGVLEAQQEMLEDGHLDSFAEL